MDDTTHLSWKKRTLRGNNRCSLRRLRMRNGCLDLRGRHALFKICEPIVRIMVMRKEQKVILEPSELSRAKHTGGLPKGEKVLARSKNKGQ